MSFFTFLYKLIIGPLIMFFDVMYNIILYISQDIGISIIFLSLTVNILILPLYIQADALQEKERIRTEKLSRGVKHIKSVFKGDERFMMLQTYYRQNDYKPYYALSGSLSLLLEIPFFIAAYTFLSNLYLLDGASFGMIRDLGQPDQLINIAGHHINFLPVLMTTVNIISGVIYTKGMPLKSKIQLYGMALIFLVFLYSSPSGLVFYWTLNNLFSLIKNVFYKIKNPVLVLCAAGAGTGCVLLPYILFIKPMRTNGLQVFSVIGSLMLIVPLIIYYAVKKYNFSFNFSNKEVSKQENLLFLVCCVFMTFFAGILIPSAVIKASPDEFVNISDFHNPLRYVLNSFALAAGTFLIWINIFYRLSSSAAKRIFSLCGIIISVSAVTNYMFFGNNYGNMSSLLVYDNILMKTKTDLLLNAVILIAIAFVIYLIWNYKIAIIQSVAIALCGAVVITSCANVFSVNKDISKLKTSLETYGNKEISLPLDKNGKNVVVIMLDRAIGEFFPFIIEEKPELKEQLAGFTFYSNTISYGNCTIIAAPALFGGYEYTPEEFNKNDSYSVVEKHNQALKLMPSVFAQNGYDVTICDPPLANYCWTPDLSIFDDIPNAKSHLVKGKLMDLNNLSNTEELRNHNFFAYSIFRSSPLFLHNALYREGTYNHSSKGFHFLGDNMYVAEGTIDGVDPIFMGSYTVLKSLPDITKSIDSGNGSFILIDNDTTHDVTMLQEPEYEPSHSIDNREYEAEHGVRHSADGRELVFHNKTQIIHYQCNVAAMMKLGTWMDYLRENNLYDNTRIIIVSDHGYNLQNLFSDSNRYDNDKFDVSSYKPLLLVKDFDSRELKIDNTFMTNADTPSIAFKELIENPVNPFTHQSITDDAKTIEKIRIASTGNYLISNYTRDEKKFKDLDWILLDRTDSSDIGSWQLISNKK